MSENISKKQQLFISEYVKDLNGASAYKRAGYKAKNDNVAKVTISVNLTSWGCGHNLGLTRYI
ncbi:MAG: terminase small subunit [Chlamydiia bacterium]|nr:terminase small subunit [Chlamydiia bacterium]